MNGWMHVAWFLWILMESESESEPESILGSVLMDGLNQRNRIDGSEMKIGWMEKFMMLLSIKRQRNRMVKVLD